MKRWLPWLAVLVCGAVVLLSLRGKPERGFHTREFGRLPVLLNGRIQPLDSVARNFLLQIRGKQSVFLEDTNKSGMFPQGKSLSATEWLMEVMMKPERADAEKVFRIDNPELLALLKLSDHEKYFSFNQLAPNFEELRRQDLRIESEKRETQSRTAFEKQVVKLLDSMMLYQRLAIMLRPPESDNMTQELEQAWKDIATLRANRNDDNRVAAQPEAVQLGQYLNRWRFMAEYSTVLLIPPAPQESRESWKTMGASLTNMLREDQIDAAVAQYAKMVTAYRANQSLEFNSALASYRLMLGQRFSSELAKGRREYFFNSFAPFYKALVIYVLAFILACASWFNFSSLLRRSAFYLVAFAWCIHTFGLVFRMILEGRPPVTNLYSSAIFIGWGAAILGMVLEKIYRDGIGSVIAATAGFLTLIIAHNLALGGDTMEMLRAVLDTNFWLATHVTVVTLGYSATFVAGFLAIIYVIRGVFTRSMDNVSSRSMARMVYGVVCFATLFSFAGTILGGIWADQSWGRFWGWDPKENGALLIVLWNAVILHARWGGLVRERGLMIMAIVGNVVTAWSWFGVNMLGIGLHSYGFTDQAFWWLLAFAASQLLLIGVGLLHKQYWRSVV